ncbi:putative invasin [Xenorhabdus mauleonii]|uniref:Invasin n=1 Tax=Xenorhabdus mauleonii TaxID=351675 RepID=A0A1I3IHR8_9GAMM|nr:inverse autotransporter beta domain-containing protein [Xenorhabdus mauleonii]PHM39507.1 putative invasin [Xenorhabdus mauleonii]SFI47456.1 Invasin, domain 3 [Xenorhabdus mauleonii]
MLKEQDRQWTKKQRHNLKWVAWVNIFAQVAFPVAAAFTPGVASAKSEHLVREAQPHAGQTRPYQLAAGESVKTVAKRHGLTVTGLKRLNQQRTFHKPFAKLGAGDEIDVPHSMSDQLLANSLKGASDYSSTGTPATETPATENRTERWLASTASQAASMLKSGNMVDTAKNQLRGMAVNEANQAVQNWLQRYGNVKIQANVDDRGRLDGSQFDMLLPLYDTAKHLTFTQFGLRHIDSRTTANVGLGQRHFFDNGMIGYNAFLDHDITRDHTRFGLGAEYARDFMKFAANGYFRASGWKDGKKLTEYEERPANGFDLRAEGYVPTYPQLGGKLMYEQYFGDEVGLLSEKQRQKNPAAFTLGVNYTPIPLVTLGLDRRQSASGGGETLFNLGLNYEIGTPWSKQIDPDAVAFRRTLQGGRYDLVDRNNQIVLEYRKKNLIRLMMESRISGRGGAVIPLNVTVSSKNSLKEIIWDTTNLVAGGGKLEAAGSQSTRNENGELFKSAALSSVSGNTHYLLTLPPYRDKGNNTYSLSGVAYDSQGNASERMEAQILVTASAVNPAGSGFEPANKSMVADGKTQTVIRLKLTDKDGKPVSGAAGSISLTDDKSKLTGDGKDPILGTEIKEVPEGSGIYEVTAIAGTKHGKWIINPKVDGHELPSTVIDFGDSLANMVDTDKTKFEPDNGNLNKENEETDIVLKLIDKEGKPITGAVDKIKLTEDRNDLYGQDPGPTVTNIKEDPVGSGIYKAKVVAGKKKGTLKVTPEVDGKELKPTHVTFGQSLAEIVDADKSAFRPATNILTADNEDSTTMTLELKDDKGNPIPNAKGSISFEDNGDQLTGTGKNKPTIDKDNIVENPQGTYTVKIKAGGKTGKWEIITKIDGKPLKNKTEINFATNKADLIDPSKSTFTTKKGGPLNPGETMEIEVDLNDEHGNPISGVEKDIKLSPDNSELYGNGEMPSHSEFKETPQGSGKYIATVTAGDKKGKWTLTPEVLGKKVGQPATITFGKSLAEALSDSSPAVDPADGNKALPADGNTKKILKITLTDSDNKPISGAKDSIKVTGDDSKLTGDGNNPHIGDVTEVGDGVYEVVITAGTKTGNWAVTTTVDGKKNPKPTELEFDKLTAPSINQLTVTGKMAPGETLSAKYDFEANGGNNDDHSFFAWGKENTTADKVKALAKAANIKEGEPLRLSDAQQEGLMRFGNVSDKGKVPDYIIPPDAVNTILELSVLPANKVNIGSSTTHTIILRKGEKGNQTTGGNNQGGVPDPNAKPSIDKIVLTGELELKKTLTAAYGFNDNGGDAIDKSLYVWHNKEETPNPNDFKPVEDTTSHILKKELGHPDAGKTIAITIKPINGQQKEGEVKTVDISMTDTDINKTVSKGGKPGTILDPDAKPSIDKLTLTGRLYFNEVLEANYIFNANNGNYTDKSKYTWTRFKKDDLNTGNRETVADPDATGTVNEKGILSGKIPSYKLSPDDSGYLLELAILPKNGGGVEAVNKVVTNTSQHDMLTGGLHGEVIDPDLGGEIIDLAIRGQLEMGQQLTGTYTFVPRDVGDSDESVFLWGFKYPDSTDPSAPQSPEKLINTFLDDTKQHINPANSGTVPETYPLTQKDSGMVIQLAMVPRGPRKALNNKIRLGAVTATDTNLQKIKKHVTGGNQDGSIKGIADTVNVDLNTDNGAQKTTDGFKIQKGKTMTLTIVTQNQGKSVGKIPIEIKLGKATGRMNKDPIEPTAQLKINGETYAKDQTYTGITDQDGKLVIEVTDNESIGLKTPLIITANDKPNVLPPNSQDVIFTVITSPDSPLANYWGHMTDEVTAGNITFKRLALFQELKAAGEVNIDETPKAAGETYAMGSWPNIQVQCTNGIADITATKALWEQEGDMEKKHGWPAYLYTTSTVKQVNGYDMIARINLSTGEEKDYAITGVQNVVSCNK